MTAAEAVQVGRPVSGSGVDDQSCDPTAATGASQGCRLSVLKVEEDGRCMGVDRDLIDIGVEEIYAGGEQTGPPLQGEGSTTATPTAGVLAGVEQVEQERTPDPEHAGAGCLANNVQQQAVYKGRQFEFVDTHENTLDMACAEIVRAVGGTFELSHRNKTKILLGEPMMQGLKTAFQQYFPPLKYRGTRNRHLRGYIKTLMADEGLEVLAGDGQEELDELYDALKKLDVPETEGRHYMWEDFVGMLGDAMGGAIYKQDVGLVVSQDSRRGLSQLERTETPFEWAWKRLHEIPNETTTADERAGTARDKENYRHMLTKRTQNGEYDRASSSAHFDTATTTPSGLSTQSGHAMNVDLGSRDVVEIADDLPAVVVAAEPVATAFDDKIAKVEREIAARTAGDSATASEDIEKRMAAKLEPAQVGDSFLRKGPLSREQEDEVDEALDGSATETLVSAFNADLTRRDLWSLLPCAWLNDEVVNMYMKLLDARDKELCQNDPNRRPSHFFSSFFLTKLAENNRYNFKGVKRWTKKVKIFQMDKVFCPVNVSNVHWCMAVIYMKEKRINYYDSMGGSGKRITDKLLLWLDDEDDDKNGDDAIFDPDDWTVEGTVVSTTPQQENGNDCGAFAVSFASYASDDLPFDFHQDDIAQMRRRMVWSLLHQKLV